MTLRTIFFGVVAFCVAAAAPARAADAGGDGGDVVEAGCGGADEAGVCCDAGGGCGAADGAAEASFVVACDGGLCDTLQGRPTCAVAAGPLGSGSGDRALPAGAAIALAAVVARRSRSGARRPGAGG